MFSIAVVIISIALVSGFCMYTLHLANSYLTTPSPKGLARKLVKDGQSIVFAIQLAEQELLASDKPVRLSVPDLVPAYLPMIPAGHANLVANPLVEEGSTEFDFSANHRVFTNGTKISDEMCAIINKNSGFDANLTAAFGDSNDDLIVSLSADHGKRPYGCDTTKHVVFYTF